jgi:hypothetical protein
MVPPCCPQHCPNRWRHVIGRRCSRCRCGRAFAGCRFAEYRVGSQRVLSITDDGELVSCRDRCYGSRRRYGFYRCVSYRRRLIAATTAAPHWIHRGNETESVTHVSRMRDIGNLLHLKAPFNSYGFKARNSGSDTAPDTIRPADQSGQLLFADIFANTFHNPI